MTNTSQLKINLASCQHYFIKMVDNEMGICQNPNCGKVFHYPIPDWDKIRTHRKSERNNKPSVNMNSIFPARG